MTSGQQPRVTTDAVLAAAGWMVTNIGHDNIHTSTGVAIGEFRLRHWHRLAIGIEMRSTNGLDL